MLALATFKKYEANNSLLKFSIIGFTYLLLAINIFHVIIFMLVIYNLFLPLFLQGYHDLYNYLIPTIVLFQLFNDLSQPVMIAKI
jgi:hypothetical protein